MTERTEEWLDELLHLTDSAPLSAVFAPVLTVEYPIQWDYLRHLAEDVLKSLSGLAVYNVNLLPDLENHPSLKPLPRLSMEPPKSPHEILRQVSLGVDVCVAPFINGVSDAGISMTFQFPSPAPGEEESIPAPLGINMWSEVHSTALVPLVEGCTCYACTNHHRAYLRHLLNAKEMLGWSLLQLHNHFVVDMFFQGIRESLQNGTFETERTRFLTTYEPEFPQGTGDRPRARGYHFKSEAAQEKINKTTWKELNAYTAVDEASENIST
jgi:queuine tRNA-ribosyltransferase